MTTSCCRCCCCCYFWWWRQKRIVWHSECLQTADFILCNEHVTFCLRHITYTGALSTLLPTVFRISLINNHFISSVPSKWGLPSFHLNRGHGGQSDLLTHCTTLTGRSLDTQFAPSIMH